MLQQIQQMDRSWSGRFGLDSNSKAERLVHTSTNVWHENVVQFLHAIIFCSDPCRKKKMANGLNENTNLPLTVGGAYGKTKIPRFIHCFQAK